jgi:hypothetical protein
MVICARQYCAQVHLSQNEIVHKGTPPVHTSACIELTWANNCYSCAVKKRLS